MIQAEISIRYKQQVCQVDRVGFRNTLLGQKCSSHLCFINFSTRRRTDPQPILERFRGRHQSARVHNIGWVESSLDRGDGLHSQ